MAGGGVSKNIYGVFKNRPGGAGQAVTCSTSGMGLRLKWRPFQVLCKRKKLI